MYKSLCVRQFPLKLDCVAWNTSLNLIALGGYQLDEATTSRDGCVYFIRPISLNFFQEIQILTQIPTPGVLDLKWGPGEYSNRLLVATATSILLLQVTLNEDQVEVETLGDYPLEKGTMSVYTEWIGLNRIAWSDTEGFLSLANLKEEPGKGILLNEVTQVKCHDFSLWVFHWDGKNNIIYTGGDDGKLRGFFLDQFQDKSQHLVVRFDVGVTSIKSHEDGELVGVGSYDEKLRIYKLDPGSKVKLIPQLEIPFGGGVWRMVWLASWSENHLFIAAACSKEGTHIVKVDKGDWSWGKVATNSDFEGNLAYGLDIYQADPERIVVASCYFENKTFQFWELEKSVN